MYCLLGLAMLGCFISSSLALSNSAVGILDKHSMTDTSALPAYSSRAAASAALDSTFSADSDLSIEIDPLMEDARYDSLSRRSGLDSSMGIASVDSYDSRPNHRTSPMEARPHAVPKQHHIRPEAEHLSHSRYDHDSRAAYDILQVWVAGNTTVSLR